MFTERIKQLTPSKTTMSSQVASQLKAEGKDVISLGLGEPDFQTPKYILDGVQEAMYQGLGHHYTPGRGILELRQAISDFHFNHDGVRYTPEEIFVADGAKMALYFLCQILVEPGVEVFIPSPYWVSYVEQVKLAGGRPVIVETKQADHFKVNPELLDQYVTEDTKILVLNTPSNPTGQVYSEEELQAIGQYCVAHNILIIADEMYYRLVYGDARSFSMMSLPKDIREQTIIVNGFSKAYAMTGWRLGYVLANEEIITQLAKLSSQTNSNVTGLTQYAGLTALTGDNQSFERMHQEFSKRLDNAYQQVTGIPGFKLPDKPQGAFYLFPDVSKAVEMTGFQSVDDFVQALLEEEFVLVIPGSAFGASQNIRLSYATSEDIFNQAIKRIERFIIHHS